MNKLKVKLQEIKSESKKINNTWFDNFKITLNVGIEKHVFNANFKTFEELKNIIKKKYPENLYSYKEFLKDYKKGEFEEIEML